MPSAGSTSPSSTLETGPSSGAAPCVTAMTSPWRHNSCSSSSEAVFFGSIHLGQTTPRRMQSEFCPQLARLDEERTVQAQRIDCGSTGGSSADDSCTRWTPAEVLISEIGARVEEWNKSRSARVQSSRARLLVDSACEATQAEVVEVLSATTRLGENVVDREIVPRDRRLRVPVLAQPSRAVHDDLPQRRRQAAHPIRRRA
jgi:hypothetical protein